MDISKIRAEGKTPLNAEKIRSEVNRINGRLKKAYSKNPDNQEFDLIMHKIFMETGIYPATPHIYLKDFRKNWDGLLDTVEYLQEVDVAQTDKNQDFSKSLDTLFSKINLERDESGKEYLTLSEKIKIKNIFKSDVWEKIKEVTQESEPVLDKLEDLIQDNSSITSNQLILILDDFLQKGSTKKTQITAQDFVDYIDEYVKKI